LDEAIAQLARLAREHQVELIAIGNGTASRETDRLGAEFIRLHPELELTEVVVSEGPLRHSEVPLEREGANSDPSRHSEVPPQLAGPQLGEPPAPTVWGKLENGTALSSSRMAPAMLSSMLLRSKHEHYRYR